jgi:hypothetical protein
VLSQRGWELIPTFHWSRIPATSLPLLTTILPAMVAVDGFMVNPFFAIASLSCFSVAVLPGFSFCGRESLLKAHSDGVHTRNRPQGHAHGVCTDLSIHPENRMSIDLISAEAETATNNSSSEIVLFIPVSWCEC